MIINSEGTCLSRIRAAMRNESGALARIGRLVLKAPLRARNLSIGKLALACNVSPATVHRFCRNLGYSGYREFQLDLVTTTARTDAIAFDEFTEATSPEAIIHRVFDANRHSLMETERRLDYRVMVRVARLIQRSRKVLFLGLGMSGWIARYAQDTLGILGLTAIAMADPYSQIFATVDIGPQDVVVGMSHAGQTTNVVDSLREARRRGAHTVAITNYPQSPLAAVSDYALITAFREVRTDPQAYTSNVIQMAVIDALFFILSSWCERKVKRLSDQAARRSEKVLWIPVSKRDHSTPQKGKKAA